MNNCDYVGNVFYVAVPILKPYPADGVDGILQEKFLNEIGLLDGSYYVDGVKIDYKSLPDVENYGRITRLLSPGRHGNNKIFVFQMTISNASHLLKPYDKLSAEQNFFFSMFYYLPTFVYALAYALGIYSNGIFDVDDFVTYYDDCKMEKSGGLLNSFFCLYDENDDICKLQAGLSLKKVLDWLLSIDDVVNACGKTALGKSLSIYSRMFSGVPSDEELFMDGLLAVMALEALYESHGSKNALIEKIAAFLNIDKRECEKDIKKIYEHRCSVAHGGFELPFKFNAPDASEEFEKSYDKVQTSFYIGLRYLLKSYRKMILQNKKDLSFAYTCL